MLRIPIDDAAFKAYLEAFKRYQTQLGEQPDMWAEINERIIENVTVADALASAINRQIDNATRLGNVEERNVQRKHKERQEEETEQQRASKWRLTALGHVQELSRTSATITRGLSNFGNGGTGFQGLNGGVAKVAEVLGGALGGFGALLGSGLALAGGAVVAGYESNKRIVGEQIQASGIGARNIGRMESFRNVFGTQVGLDTDTGINSVANSLSPGSGEWTALQQLHIKPRKGESADEVYSDVIGRQYSLLKKYRNADGSPNLQALKALGAMSFGTDANALRNLDTKTPVEIRSLQQQALHGQDGNPLSDIEKNKKAMQSVTDAQQALSKAEDTATSVLSDLFTPALKEAVKALNGLSNIANHIVSLFPKSWNPSSAIPTIRHETDAERKAAEADPNNPRGKGLWGGLKTMWNSPWFSIHHEGDPMGGSPGGSGPTAAGAANAMLGKGASGRMAAIAAALKVHGFSDQAAMSAAAGVMAESNGGNPFAVNPNSGAFGIEQLLGDRKKNYFAMAANDKVDPTNLQEQVKFLAWELKGGDKGGHAVTTATDFAKALHAYVFDFMRPQGAHNEHLIDAIRDMQRGAAALAKAGIHIKIDNKTGAATAITANNVARAG